MLNNNDIKGDFSSLASILPSTIMFEYKNINEKSNSAVVGTD